MIADTFLVSTITISFHEIFDKLREFITESYAYKWAIENLIPEKIYEFLK